MARVMVLHIIEGIFEVTECNDLDDYYKKLGAEPINIVSRKIDDKYFDIICDDMGLCRENPIVSGVAVDRETFLVGNLIFANHDGQGNEASLTDEDILTIFNNTYPYVDKDGNQRIFVEFDY